MSIRYIHFYCHLDIGDSGLIAISPFIVCQYLYWLLYISHFNAFHPDSTCTISLGVFDFIFIVVFITLRCRTSILDKLFDADVSHDYIIAAFAHEFSTLYLTGIGALMLFLIR